MNPLNQQGAAVNPTAFTEGRQNESGLLGVAGSLFGGLQNLSQSRANRARREADALEAEQGSRLNQVAADTLATKTELEALLGSGSATDDQLAQVISGAAQDGQLTPHSQAVLAQAQQLGKLSNQLAKQGRTQEAINIIVGARLNRLVAGNEDIAGEILTLAGKDYGKNFANVDENLRDDIKARQTAEREAAQTRRFRLEEAGILPLGSGVDDSTTNAIYAATMANEDAQKLSLTRTADILEEEVRAGKAGAELRLQTFLEESAEISAKLFKEASAVNLNITDPVERANAFAALGQRYRGSLLARGIPVNDPRIAFVEDTIKQAIELDPTQMKTDEYRRQSDEIQAKTTALVVGEKYRMLRNSPNVLATSVWFETTQFVPRIQQTKAFAALPESIRYELSNFIGTAGGVAEGQNPVSPLPANKLLNAGGPVERQALGVAKQTISGFFAAPGTMPGDSARDTPESHAAYLSALTQMMKRTQETGKPELMMDFYKGLASPDFGEFMASGRGAEGVSEDVRKEFGSFASASIGQARRELMGKMSAYQPVVTVDDKGRFGIRFNNPQPYGSPTGTGSMSRGIAPTTQPRIPRGLQKLIEETLPTIAKAAAHIRGAMSPEEYASAAMAIAADLNRRDAQ